MFDQASTLNPMRVGLDYVSDGDGTTNTLLFSEKAGRNVTMPEWHTPTLDANTWTTTTNTYPGVITDPSPPARAAILTIPAFVHPEAATVADAAKLQMVNATASKRVEIARGLTSNHPGGVMAAFCDSHIGFLSDSLETRVYSQLMTCNRKTISATGIVKDLDSNYPILSEGDFK